MQLGPELEEVCTEGESSHETEVVMTEAVWGTPLHCRAALAFSSKTTLRSTEYATGGRRNSVLVGKYPLVSSCSNATAP